MQRKESGGYGYMYPGVIFGIKNPGNFAYYKDGGYFCYATAEGALCVRGNDFSAVAQAPAGYSRETVHTMTISVRYGRVTVKISGDGNNPEPAGRNFARGLHRGLYSPCGNGKCMRIIETFG